MSKALLIKSYTEIITGVQGEWNELTMAASYIQGIQTGDILHTVDASTLSALVSGVPSPWARAKLLKYSLDTLSRQNPNINDGGLLNFYRLLRSEWRGLLAVMALYPDRITISKPVILDTRGKAYSISSAFGSMLFEDRDIWSNQQALAGNPDEQPYVQIIYYRGIPVGATSPFTAVFAGVNYSNAAAQARDIPWFRQGRFEDPLKYLTPDQLQKLYLFIHNMCANLTSFEENVNSQRGGKPKVNLIGFKTQLRGFAENIQKASHLVLRQLGPIAKFASLQFPFSDLFNSNVPVYLNQDYTFSYIAKDGSRQIGDIQDLLSSDSHVLGWVESSNQRPKLADAPVFFLRCIDIQNGDTSYFSLPLSELGIDIFRNKLSSILGYSGVSTTRITGKITDSGMLSVTLTVEIDGESVTLNDREYIIDWVVNQSRVILWPNFTSENWNRYYFFTEYTDDAMQQFLPIFKRGGEILKTIDGDFVTSRTEISPQDNLSLRIKKLVVYPADVPDDLPKYNILTSNLPVCGVKSLIKVSGKIQGAGFLMTRQDVIADLTNVQTLSTAVVGVDFGSNNTCLFYNPDGQGARPIEFGNYRAVLVGRENTDLRAIADNSELLFFSNYPSKDGQLKSWLHEHDTRYVENHQSDEVAGGVPVNRPNVRVKEMDRYEIKTQAGVLHYNMKWLDNSKGREKKRAFLKSVWLQACAFLYTNRIDIQEICWSFPGAMMESDIDNLERIYDDLARITPYGRVPKLHANHITEAEAVCSYAMSQNFGITARNMFLGIDVGGSSSDILLLARNPMARNAISLFRESSVRVAAGVFFDAVIQSDRFRRALLTFHEGHSTDVHVENIGEVVAHPDKAPHYLNSIFDQLKTQDDYRAFYDSLATNAKHVFTIPAYVSGLLLFYSGILIGKVLKDNGLDNISVVDIMPFGKGGRIFHWLRYATSSRTMNDYYSTCVNSGLQSVLPGRTVEVHYHDEIEENNKTEVARGLCDMKDFTVVTKVNDTDICGETDVKYIDANGHTLDIALDEEIPAEKFNNDMNHFDFTGVKNFERFMDIFVEFVGTKTQLFPNAETILRGDIQRIPSMVGAYCTGEEEYRKAKDNNRNGRPFCYHQPIIIAEGACFQKQLIARVFE